MCGTVAAIWSNVFWCIMMYAGTLLAVYCSVRHCCRRSFSSSLIVPGSAVSAEGVAPFDFFFFLVVLS